MLFLQLLGLKIEIVDFAINVLTGLPRTRKWRLQTFFRDVKQIAVFHEVHAEVPSIVFNLLLSRLIVFRQLLFEDLKTLSHQCLPSRRVIASRAIRILMLLLSVHHLRGSLRVQLVVVVLIIIELVVFNLG